MAKKGKQKRNVAPSESSIGGGKPTHWMIVAAILVFFSAAFVIKIVFAPVSGTGIDFAGNGPDSGGSAVLESQVKLVAANFRCACGKCGELFLVDCTCDMPQGAVEEKNFIRNKLQQGLTVDQVIQLVDKEYGHRIG